MKERCTSIIHFLFGTIFLLFADQLSKIAAEHFLPKPDGIQLIPKVLCLLYVENRGAAFGMLSGKQLLFIILTVALMVFLFLVWLRMPKTPYYAPLRCLAVLLCGGAAGNLMDRIFRGYVVDFIYFSIIDFPVFNLADIFVCVSCFLIVVLLIFHYKDQDFSWLTGDKKC